MTVHQLNALLGSIGKAGGVRHFHNKDLHKNSNANKNANTNTNTYLSPEVLIYRDDDRLKNNFAQFKVLLSIGANISFPCPSPLKWEKIIKKIPFVAFMSTWMDETNYLADIILPMAHPLELFQAGKYRNLHGESGICFGKKVLDPKGQSKDPADLLIELAKKLNDNIEQENFSTFVKDKAMSMGAGALFKNGAWVEFASESPSPKKCFKNPSKKFVFQSHRQLYHQSFNQSPNQSYNFFESAMSDLEIPVGKFSLQLFVPIGFSAGIGAHIPYLQGIGAGHLNESWRTWVEINPNSAKALGVKEGDRVQIQSEFATIKATARFTKGLR